MYKSGVARTYKEEFWSFIHWFFKVLYICSSFFLLFVFHHPPLIFQVAIISLFCCQQQAAVTMADTGQRGCSNHGLGAGNCSGGRKCWLVFLEADINNFLDIVGEIVAIGLSKWGLVVDQHRVLYASKNRDLQSIWCKFNIVWHLQLVTPKLLPIFKRQKIKSRQLRLKVMWGWPTKMIRHWVTFVRGCLLALNT